MEAREKQVAEIRAILQEWGEFSVGERKLDSPLIVAPWKDNATVERFNLDDVYVVHYVQDFLVDEYWLTYYELPVPIFEEVYQIIQDYAIEMERTFNRCKDNNY